jgi:23S rRNA pseudouridine1911/1915/1917 synthase
MNKQFHDRLVQKKYLAVVTDKPRPEEGLLVHYLKKNTERNVVRAYEKEVRDSKRAELFYRVVQYGSSRSVVEVMPKTGRPHQIRVQLSALGHPILGDVKYGAPNPLPGHRIALHSWRLSFEHPVTLQPLALECPVPEGEQLDW